MRKTMMAAACVIALCAPVRAEYVTAKAGLCVRSEPSTDAQVVAVLPFATKVDGKTRGEWIELSDGYVLAEYVGEENPLDGYESMGAWKITAYYETGMATASGVYPEVNVTMAHNSLPFGTELYIEGLGFWTVQDRGPASMGTEWCDLYLGDYGTCVQFGEQHAEVWVVKEP